MKLKYYLSQKCKQQFNKLLYVKDNAFRLIPLFLFSLLFPTSVLYGQVDVDSSFVSFKKESVTVPYILDEITQQTNIRFFYSPDFFQKDKFSVDYDNLSVSEILTQLLNKKFCFDLKGDDVVIFRDNSKLSDVSSIANDSIASPSHQSEIKNIYSKNDTLAQDAIVYQSVYDTIVLHDTLLIRDTITKIDTVYIRPVVKKPYRHKRIFKNTRLGDAKSRKFRLEPYYEQHFLTSNYEGTKELTHLYKNSEKGECYNFKVGADVGYKMQNVLISTGIGYRGITENFVYSYNKPEISFYQHDTLDVYYTLQDTDTLWYYVMDSTFVTLPGEKKEYNVKNRYHLLEIPVTLSYIIENNGLDIRVKGGVVSSFLISAEGYFIEDYDPFPVVKIEKSKLNSFSMDMMLAADIIYDLGNGYSVISGVNYRTGLINLFPDSYPVKKSWDTFGLHIGFQIDF